MDRVTDVLGRVAMKSVGVRSDLGASKRTVSVGSEREEVGGSTGGTVRSTITGAPGRLTGVGGLGTAGTPDGGGGGVTFTVNGGGISIRGFLGALSSSTGFGRSADGAVEEMNVDGGGGSSRRAEGAADAAEDNFGAAAAFTGIGADGILEPLRSGGGCAPWACSLMIRFASSRRQRASASWFRSSCSCYAMKNMSRGEMNRQRVKRQVTTRIKQRIIQGLSFGHAILGEMNMSRS